MEEHWSNSFIERLGHHLGFTLANHYIHGVILFPPNTDLCSILIGFPPQETRAWKSYFLDYISPNPAASMAEGDSGTQNLWKEQSCTTVLFRPNCDPCSSGMCTVLTQTGAMFWDCSLNCSQLAPTNACLLRQRPINPSIKTCQIMVLRITVAQQDLLYRISVKLRTVAWIRHETTVLTVCINIYKLAAYCVPQSN